MRRRLITGTFAPALTLALILGATGCGKKATQPAAPQPAPAVESPAQPTPQPSQPSQSAAQPNNQPDLAEINRYLIRWIVGHKKRPATFEEFAATAGVTIPPAPAGKKYAIAANPPKVELVNQ